MIVGMQNLMGINDFLTLVKPSIYADTSSVRHSFVVRKKVDCLSLSSCLHLPPQ